MDTVHSVSAYIMGSHIVYKPVFFNSKFKIYGLNVFLKHVRTASIIER